MDQSVAPRFVFGSLENALHEQRPAHRGGLIHDSDNGRQCTSIEYTECLSKAAIEPSDGSVDDSYDKARAEMNNDFYKAGVIHSRGPWRLFEAAEFDTMEWID